jgi:hypothetical protein
VLYIDVRGHYNCTRMWAHYHTAASVMPAALSGTLGLEFVALIVGLEGGSSVTSPGWQCIVSILCAQYVLTGVTLHDIVALPL